MGSGDARLSMRGVRFSHGRLGEGGVWSLGPIDVDLPAGALTALVGPNGAGKSTLLRLAAGLWQPLAGEVRLDGTALSSMPRLVRAQRISFLPQQAVETPGVTALDVVLLGLYPATGRGYFDSDGDRARAMEALRGCEAEALGMRAMEALSAGERQRVSLAAALVQQPSLLVLDEPTSMLDPYHQLNTLGTLRRCCEMNGASVVVAVHDLNLAARYADALVLLDGGRVVASGDAAAVLRPEVLDPVYGVRFELVAGDQCRGPLVVATPADGVSRERGA